MNPSLHAIVYVGASAIALTYAFLRILEENRRWQGAAAFAFAFFFGLDAYVWLKVGDPPEEYPLLLHGIDWSAALCAFGAGVYLREPLDPQYPGKKLTIGLWLFSTYALLCVAFWGVLAAQSESSIGKEIWKKFYNVAPEGPIYIAVSNCAFRDVSNSIYSSMMATNQPLRTSDPASVRAILNDRGKEIEVSQLRRTACLAMVLYGLCFVVGVVLVVGSRCQRKAGKFFDFRSQHLWIGVTVGLYFASLAYLLYLRSCRDCLCFAVGAPTAVLTLIWLASGIKEERPSIAETRPPKRIW